MSPTRSAAAPRTPCTGPSRSSRPPTSAKTRTKSSTSGCSRTRRATRSTPENSSTPSPTRLSATTRHADRALVMNIATGGGTLVHEIVHPFVAANFPDCPAWFNEGLGSLYEQCGEEDGQIHGYTNWRLPGLQAAIRKHRRALVQNALLDHQRGVLREGPGARTTPRPDTCATTCSSKGCCRSSIAASTPTGRTTRPATTRSRTCSAGTDMAEFQKEWEAYVLKLRFR